MITESLKQTLAPYKELILPIIIVAVVVSVLCIWYENWYDNKKRTELRNSEEKMIRESVEELHRIVQNTQE